MGNDIFIEAQLFALGLGQTDVAASVTFDQALGECLIQLWPAIRGAVMRAALTETVLSHFLEVFVKSLLLCRRQYGVKFFDRGGTLSQAGFGAFHELHLAI